MEDVFNGYSKLEWHLLYNKESYKWQTNKPTNNKKLNKNEYLFFLDLNVCHSQIMKQQIEIKYRHIWNIIIYK